MVPSPSTYTYSQSSRPSAEEGETLAVYEWAPKSSPRGVALLLHGFRSHSHYTFLRNDGPGQLHRYGSDTLDTSAETPTSFVRELIVRGIRVFSYDHVGHGRSTGERAYFSSFDILVSDATSLAKEIRSQQSGEAELPIFVVGHSLGGTVAISMVTRHPDLFSGVLLSSAASEPPRDMFGLKGMILASCSALLSAVVPKLEVMTLPKNTEMPEMQELFDSDPLNASATQLRARVGREFLQAYAQIAKSVHQVKTPFLAASGERDTLVDPLASTRFHDGASSKDKTLHIAKGRWHNLFTEVGKEEIWTLFADWILQRL